jgi:hypothetical protein
MSNVRPHVNDILALASEVRERYIEALLVSLHEFMASHSPSAPEVLFELQRDEPLPFRLYRADMAANADGGPQIQEVNPATHLSFEPFGVELSEGLTAAVHPFVWNDIGISSNVAIPSEQVEAWALRWHDMEDQFPKDEHGLQGVIHSVSYENSLDNGALLTIDFGSAPIQALQELIELLVACGASHVSIRSQSLQ